jgi:hypothetical protein
VFIFRCKACGEAFHQPLQPYASSDHSLRHKAWLHTWRGITESRPAGWPTTRAGWLAHRFPNPLIACLSISPTYKACTAAFSPCSAKTSTAALGRLLASPKSPPLYCYQRNHSLECSCLAVFTQPSLHPPRGRTTEVSGFAAAFSPTKRTSVGEGLHRLRPFQIRYVFSME